MKRLNNYGWVKVQIQPERKGDRVAFGIILPHDVGTELEMCAICVPGNYSSDWLNGMPMPLRASGRLSMRMDGIGDIFMQIPIDTGLHWDDNQITTVKEPGLTDLLNWSFTLKGRQIEWQLIKIPKGIRIIRCYYVDDLNRCAGFLEAYTLTVYLRYLRKDDN